MLTELLNSQTRAAVITRLFTPENQAFHVRQLARDGGLSAPGVLKELVHLHELKLIKKRENKGRTEYYADKTAPLFPILCELVDKTEGLHGKLRRMLSGLDIDCLFIYGSEANGTNRPDSDIDLFIIGKCTLLEISQALLPAADLTNREINPVLYSPDAFRRKCLAHDHFIQNVVISPKLFLKGGIHEFNRLAG